MEIDRKKWGVPLGSAWNYQGERPREEGTEKVFQADPKVGLQQTAPLCREGWQHGSC